MRRSLGLALIVIVAILLVPTFAFAADGGSDTDFFARAMSHGPLVAAGAAFVGGLLVSLTPCVYPMIAITVSVFGANEAKSRGQAAALSGVFVLGIATLFTILGVATAASGGLFGSMLANKWVVGGIALVFLALSASMFGAFELALPSGLNNRLATVGGIGYKGAFTLGLVSALVAAPCTGPALTGILIWIATTHNLVLGTLVMFTFALGLGVPFFLVGTFAISLPKGGAWMIGVKWVFGVVLAVVALYFLRNAIPALQHVSGKTTGVLVGYVVAFAIGLALASVHIAAERKKSPIAHLSKPMKLVSIPFAIIGGYMIIAWILTPKAELEWLTSEQAAVAQAQAEHRPLIVDFGASWCTACNELATTTFADKTVRDEAGRFVAVRVDATDNDAPGVTEVKDKYKVVGLPTVIVLDSQGNEKVRFNEFVPPEKFVSAIKAVD
ncbi:MAG: cytochrome c biogenesis protein CcdA [Polyangiaceae bacterium]